MSCDEHLRNYKWRVTSKFSASWNLSFIKTLFCTKTSPKQNNRRQARQPFPAGYAAYSQLCLICRLIPQNYFTELYEGQWVDADRDLKLSKALLQTSPVSFNKRHQNEEAFFRNIHGTRMFLLLCFPVTIRETLFSLSVFPRWKLCLLSTAGNFSQSPSMRVVAKILH